MSGAANVIFVDTPAVTRLIGACLTLSVDGQLGELPRRDFLVAGKRLRGCLVNLVTAQFNDDTDMVLDANRQLVRINQQAAYLKDDLASAANVLSEINVVVGMLDELLNLAVAFH